LQKNFLFYQKAETEKLSAITLLGKNRSLQEAGERARAEQRQKGTEREVLLFSEKKQKDTAGHTDACPRKNRASTPIGGRAADKKMRGDVTVAAFYFFFLMHFNNSGRKKKQNVLPDG